MPPPRRRGKRDGIAELLATAPTWKQKMDGNGFSDRNARMVKEIMKMTKPRRKPSQHNPPCDIGVWRLEDTCVPHQPMPKCTCKRPPRPTGGEGVRAWGLKRDDGSITASTTWTYKDCKSWGWPTEVVRVTIIEVRPRRRA